MKVQAPIPVTVVGFDAISTNDGTPQLTARLEFTWHEIFALILEVLPQLWFYTINAVHWIVCWQNSSSIINQGQCWHFGCLVIIFTYLHNFDVAFTYLGNSVNVYRISDTSILEIRNAILVRVRAFVPFHLFIRVNVRSNCYVFVLCWLRNHHHHFTSFLPLWMERVGMSDSYWLKPTLFLKLPIAFRGHQCNAMCTKEYD